MIWQLDLLLFAILIVAAVWAVHARDLLAAAGLMAVFSLVVALLFTGMQALDVTFVEAGLGAGITGVLLIAAVLATDRRAAPRDRARRGTRWLAVPMVGLLGLVWVTTAGLPDRGDPDAPASDGAAPVYVERSLADTETPNVVAAVLADYRGHDTLGETLVIVTSAAAAVLVLFRRREDDT